MADNENKEEVSKSNTDQRIKNYLAISDIKKYLDVYWTDKKLGKHKTMKEKTWRVNPQEYESNTR